MKRFNLFAAVVGCFMVAATGAQAATISVNFVGGNQNAPVDGTGAGAASVTQSAGAVFVPNWNNIIPVQNVTVNNLIDDTGAATSASISYSFNNTWSANNAAPGGGSDADMMSGYIDNTHNQGPISISDIPYAEYELRIYHNTDSPGTMGFTVDDGNTSTTYYSHMTVDNGGNYPLAGPDPFGGSAGFVGSQDTNSGSATDSNYTLFTGLTGSSLSIQGVSGTNGDGRARPNGFQITGEIPEPTTFVLAGLGFLCLAGVRRRRRR